jgi:hypothetical protein
MQTPWFADRSGNDAGIVYVPEAEITKAPDGSTSHDAASQTFACTPEVNRALTTIVPRCHATASSGRTWTRSWEFDPDDDCAKLQMQSIKPIRHVRTKHPMVYKSQINESLPTGSKHRLIFHGPIAL